MTTIPGLDPQQFALQLVAEQRTFFSAKDTVDTFLDGAKSRLSTERKAVAENVTDDDRHNVDVSDIRSGIPNLTENELFVLIEKLESMVEYASNTLDEKIAARIGTDRADNIEQAKQAYETATQARGRFEAMLALFQQFGFELPKEAKVKEGKTGLLPDFGKLTNPENTNTATGKRDYTVRLPVFTIDGQELPHGTTFRTVALDHLKLDGARDLQKLVKEAYETDDIRDLHWTIHLADGTKVSGTEYREVKDS